MSIVDPNVLFRANSVASKGIDSLMKLLSTQYLSKILSAIIKSIYSSKQSCEVDTTRIEQKDHKKNLDALTQYCVKIWTTVRDGVEDVPK